MLVDPTTGSWLKAALHNAAGTFRPEPDRVQMASSLNVTLRPGAGGSLCPSAPSANAAPPARSRVTLVIAHDTSTNASTPRLTSTSIRQTCTTPGH